VDTDSLPDLELSSVSSSTWKKLGGKIKNTVNDSNKVRKLKHIWGHSFPHFLQYKGPEMVMYCRDSQWWTELEGYLCDMGDSYAHMEPTGRCTTMAGEKLLPGRMLLCKW
jgi:hypothetical protein